MRMITCLLANLAGRRLGLLGITLVFVVLVCGGGLGQEVSNAKEAVASEPFDFTNEVHLAREAERIETALGSAEPGNRGDELELLTRLAHVQSNWGDALWQRASESEDEEERSRLNASAVLHFKEALAFWRRAGDREGEAGALFSLASLYGDIGNQWKSSACFAQARAIQRDLYKPSLGRQISDFIARSARRFCAVTATTPEFALPLLLIFGGISAMAARWTRAPVVRWALRGSGLGLAVFLGCMAGMGWITGDVGYDHSLSYYLPARLLVVVFAGIVAWTAVRLMAKNVVASRETR